MLNAWLQALRLVLPMLTVAWLGSVLLAAPSNWRIASLLGLALASGPPAIVWAIWLALRWRESARSTRLAALFRIAERRRRGVHADE